jgi:hypothetical protein
MTAAGAAATTNLQTIVFLPTKGAVRASIKPTAYSIQSFLPEAVPAERALFHGALLSRTRVEHY